MAVLVMACCLLTNGQDFDHYKTLLPQGIVPRDFTDRSTEKFAVEINSISNTDKRRDKRDKKKFYLESTFSVDEFLGSGSVLFNDEVSMYLSSVLTEILKPYPELQSKVRVYAVKSAIPNAFTTNNGLIFVNLGLLARLDNEAQLAFILAHEVVHFQKKHVINKYVTNIDIDRARGDYRKLSRDSKGFAKSSYSKELESEADLGGADIYAQSAYSKDSLDKVFDILNLADFPLNWVPFDRHAFESPRYIFPDTLTPKGLTTAIHADDNYNDSLRSHPNTRKRKEAINTRFRSEGKGDDYRVSKSWFEKSRKLARYELCRTYLLDHRYLEAMLLAQSLQERDPNSAYLRQTVAKAFYGLGKDRIRHTARGSEDFWGGAPANLREFFNRQKAYEISVTAIRQLYRAHEAEPDNAEITIMLYDLIRSLALEEKELGKRFLRKSTDQPVADLKYPYTQYAFLDFKNTEAFFELFDKQVAAAKKEAPVSRSRRARKAERAKAKPINLTKVVVVNPMYKKVDIRKRQKVRYTEAEEVLVNIDDEIRTVAEKLDLKVEIINPNTVSSSKVAVMQTNSVMNDWIDEQMRSEDKVRVSPIYNEVVALADAYKTDHFVWMGDLTLTRTRKGKAYLIGGSILVPAVVPLLGPLVFIPRGMTLHFGLVFNVRTQQVELVDLRQIDMRDNPYLRQSNMYYTFLKLKKVRL
jgi:beta-barrel assembly-enhancing protease